jgi:Fic family protein
MTPPIRPTGTYKTSTTAGEAVRAFIPYGLPPRNPPLEVGGECERLLEAATQALGRLRIASQMVASTGWFLYGFVRKEAVITSQIEGTQATLNDVLTFEGTDETNLPEDVEEVCDYVHALNFARRELANPTGLPVSTRLLCEAHGRLMRGVRGASKDPGHIRRSQNWIGSARPGTASFVPPPAEDVPEALAAMETWIHSADPLPAILKAGLAHAQFETIHPFLDGNGRIGRLLITLLLEHWRVPAAQMLYLSLAFKHHQSEYYARLSAIRTDGDWEGWVKFYLSCVREAADDGTLVAQRLFSLLALDRRRATEHARATVSSLRLLEILPENPVVTVARAAALLKTSAPTARKAVTALMEAGVLRESSGRRRDRVFEYSEYISTLTGAEG